MTWKKYGEYTTEEKQQAKERWHRWAEKNREHLREYSRRYNEEHPDIHLKASRKYAAKHRESQTLEELNKTATWIGRRFELEALKLLPGAQDLNGDKMNHPGYDLIYNGLRIDVKGKKLWKRKNRTEYIRKKWFGYVSKAQWTFHPASTGSDAILCLGYDFLGQKLLKAFLIPKDKYAKTGVTIMETGGKKYDKYELVI